MTEDQKKVSFNIQFSQKNPTQAPTRNLRMITDWQYGRIAAAVAGFVVLAIVAVNLMTDSEPPPKVVKIATQETKKTPVVKAITDRVPQQKKLIEQKAEIQEPVSVATTKAPETPSSEVKVKDSQKASQYLAKGILRSQLAVGIWQNEPFGDVELPIKVNSKEATGLFYFTEVEGLLGSSIYHVWKRDGKLIFKQEKSIGGKQFRTYTSKLFTRASIGPWTVSVTDSELVPLHTIEFNVVAE
jgi:hypothetical protein